MKRALAAIFVALSIGLNVAFITGWLVSHWHTLPIWSQPAAPVTGPGHGDGEVWHPMHHRLGVGRQQWQRLEPEVRRFYDQIQPIQREIAELRGELLDLLAQPQPDQEAIEAKQKQLLDHQANMQDLVVQQLLTEKQALTPEQQQQFFELLRRRARHHPGTGFGPPDRTRHHGEGRHRGPGHMMRRPGSDSEAPGPPRENARDHDNANDNAE